MFGNSKAFNGFAVPDIEEARRFYGETLGIETSEDTRPKAFHSTAECEGRSSTGRSNDEKCNRFKA